MEKKENVTQCPVMEPNQRSECMSVAGEITDLAREGARDLITNKL